MIKIKKRNRLLFLFSVIFLFVLSLSLVACGDNKTKKLSAPENIRVELRVLYWDGVENADCYKIVVEGGKTYETTSCEYPLSDWRWGEDYEISIFAKTKDGKYQTSEGAKSKFTIAAPVAEGYDGNGFKYVWMQELNAYEVSKGKATLSKELVIPDYFQDFPVKRITDFGFSIEKFMVATTATWWDEKGCNVVTTSIQLPKYLESIGNSAFSYMTRLEEVVIPDTVTQIEDYAFEACAKLKKVVLPKQLKEIGNGTFETTALETLDLPDGLEVVGRSAFACGLWPSGHQLSSKLSRVVIPASVKEVGSNAFDGRENLTEIVFEDLGNLEYISMKSMPAWWYENNGEVIDGVYYIGNILMETREDFQAKEFTVPSHVKLINSFDGRGVIEKLYIPDGVEMDCSLRYGCENLKEVRLPADMTRMIINFFANTPSLEKVIIPEGIQDVSSIFGEGNGIKELTIFTKVKMGDMKNPKKTQFYCPDLTTINYQGVTYTYSAEKPTEEGNYWYVERDYYCFEIWT